MTARALAFTLLATLISPSTRAACEPCDQARALREAGKPKDAVALLKKAAKADKASAEIQALLVLCALDLGKPKDAGAALPKFLSLEPTPAQLEEVRAAVANAAPPPPGDKVRMTAPEGSEPPILVLYSGAAYPPDAREFGIGGSVTLNAIIGTDGTAKQIEMRNTGNWAATRELGFEEAAVEALRRWRFFPALSEGRPVESALTVVGIFEMIE